jgi:hypothetical protein
MTVHLDVYFATVRHPDTQQRVTLMNSAHIVNDYTTGRIVPRRALVAWSLMVLRRTAAEHVLGVLGWTGDPHNQT